ncbi:ABC transporter substrate-binding protein, partial [Halobacteriales archaeon QH_6_64_20]
PLDLDALGLVVNLSEVELNIDAVPGPGNLLGNLLCAVANLLN